MSTLTEESAGKPAVRVDELTVRYRDRIALDRVSLDIETGFVIGFIGPNGSGKTTLVNCIAGLITPSSGSVSLLGIDVRARSDTLKRSIGVLPQETALYGDLTVRENLRFVAELYDQPLSRVDEALRLVGLEDRAGSRARSLSGGMRRRVAIGRALLHDPEIVILDEPTIGIDVDSRHHIWNHVRQTRSRRKTVIVTTNYLDEAEALCDRVILLRDGHVTADTAPRALIERVGQPLELTTDEIHASRLANFIGAADTVKRVTVAGPVVTAFLDHASSPEAVVVRARLIGEVYAFRLRTPDLTEIFDALAQDSTA